MPSFKSKNSKQLKVCKKYNSTLDGKHHDFTNEFFHNETERIPKLKEERTQLKVKIASIKVFTIEEIMDFKDRVIEINDTIKELKHKKENVLRISCQLQWVFFLFFLIFLQVCPYLHLAKNLQMFFLH